jgi:condensin complex subunit 1
MVFFTEWIVESCLNQTKAKKKEIKKARRKIKPENTGVLNKENEKNRSKSKKNLKGILDSANKNRDHDVEIRKEEVTALNPESILKSFSKLVNLELKYLFRNKIVEEDFMNSLIKICFDLLELSNENRDTKNNTNQTKEMIFEILQHLITKYQSNVNVQIILIKLTTKIVNLIYNQESLVNYLSDFVVLAINGDSNMNKLAVDIIHEMSKTIFEDENFDSQGLKNVGRFLVILSEKSPKTIYTNISSLLRLFDSESYVIRNTLVEVISNVIIKILCNIDDIQEVDTRNNYLKTKEKFIEILFDRIYDKSGFCRSKVLHIFEKLCDHNTISVNNYNKLLKEASGRLKDEKAHVRKRAISLISKIILIYAAIFKCDRFLTYEEIQSVMDNSDKNAEECIKKIKEIDNKLIDISKKYEDDVEDGRSSPVIHIDKEPSALDLRRAEELEDEKNKLRDEINKEQTILDYFHSYKSVLKAIDNIIPLAIQLLGSKNFSDVQETIDLFVVLHKLRISSAFLGVKKMLNLIIKPEESIRKKLLEAYQQIYFSSDKGLDIQAAYLIDLTVNLNFSEFTCLRELLKNLISSNTVNMNIFKEVWKIMIRDPQIEITKLKITSPEELHSKMNQLVKESRAALQILNIAGDYDSSVLLNNADVYTKNILLNLQKKNIDWLIIKESLVGLQKIYSMKKDSVEFSLLKISKAIIKGYGTEDNNWFIATQELIDTIFHIVTNPEKISQYLIIKLSRPLFATKLNKIEADDHFMTQNIESAPKFNNEGMDVEGQGAHNAEPSSDQENELNPTKLSQLIFVVGHVALNMVVYAEKLESNLKKKKNEKTPNKDKSQDDIQEIAGGKEAEIEYDINLLHKIVEEEILYKNLLGKFAPLIIDIAHRILVCDRQDMESNLFLYKSAILSLCKFMCISAKFCEDNLPFLFDLLNSELIDPSLKLNICAAFGDFINRFPNILQKQVSKFFTCLHSKNQQVARYSMTVISHLVLNDMLKLKGEVVDISMLLESEDQKIKDLINLFFYELNQKGNNVLYNVIPKALAKLSNEYKYLEYERFQNIVKNLLKYVEKDKHTEGLIEKLFMKLKNSVGKKINFNLFFFNFLFFRYHRMEKFYLLSITSKL